MSIGNTKDKGNNYGNNYPYQLANLKLLGNLQDSATVSNGTLLNILNALQSGQSFFQSLIEDQGGTGCPTNCPVYTEVKTWNGTSFDPPIYYDAEGNAYNPPGGASPALVGPIVYINPDFHLQQLVVLLTTISNEIDVALSTRASEATQLLNKGLLTTISGDTAKLDTTLSSRATEATLLLVKGVLDNIKLKTDNLDVALSTRASEATVATLSTETTLTTVKNNVQSKMDRIRGSANYTRTFSYVASGTSGSNITSIVHTGTTALGSETITETFTYFGSTTNIQTITYS